MFFIEAQTDKVVMPLHNGLPALWDQSPPLCDNTVVGCPNDIVNYMRDWSGHMIHALTAVVEHGGDGVFNPACLIHTSFNTTSPILNERNYLQAFGDWLFGRSSKSNASYDSCGVMCNPSCGH